MFDVLEGECGVVLDDPAALLGEVGESWREVSGAPLEEDVGWLCAQEAFVVDAGLVADDGGVAVGGFVVSGARDDAVREAEIPEDDGERGAEDGDAGCVGLGGRLCLL